MHFNVWRDLPQPAEDALDIGFLFNDPRTFKRLFLYIPGEVMRAHLQDLSSVLEDNTTLSAVFNDTLSVGSTDPNSFQIIKDGLVDSHVARIDFDDPARVNLTNFDEGKGFKGTVICFEGQIPQDASPGARPLG
jgi:hypothetical protein